MDFRIANAAALESSADLLAICVFADASSDPLFKAADQALGKALSQEAKAEKFTGKRDQTLRSYTRGALRAKAVLLLGAGDQGEFSLGQIRDLAATAARVARRTSAARVAFVLPPVDADQVERAAQLAAEGAMLGSYRFSKYMKGDAAKPSPIKTVEIVADRGAGKSAKGGKGAKKKPSASPSARALKAAAERGRAVAEATCRARDYINEPAAVMTPQHMAAEARALARRHKTVTAKVLDAAACKKLGMGMFLAVGQGSDQAPCLVHLTYKPAKKAKKRIALIGKGVTFDSGGYSLKPSAAMEDMKIDMSGAAAVVAAMDAIATLGSPHEVHVVTALAENLVSGRAYKLGDVLTAMDGTTVEINNTDAEGRLTLGDAIAYTRQKIGPDEIFDFATLTGACMVALGPHTAGVMSDHEELAQAWLDACDSAGEDVWRLPLNTKLKDQLKSPLADMRNTGERWGGALTAGLFLKHFAGDTPWVHVDIAGPASTNRERGALSRGGTGFGVASIVEYVTR